MSELTLKLHMKQTLRVSPQMLQSTRVLQMDAQELREYVTAALEENPLLEREPEAQAEREFAQLRREISWLDGGRSCAAAGGQEEMYRPEQAVWDRETTSLTAQLNDQLERRRLAPPLRELCRYLVQLLNEDGYLEQEDIEDIQELGVPEELLAQAIAAVQSLEPAGVAARDLRECLLLQLERLPGDTALARRMVGEQLEALGKKRWRMLAETFSATEEAVQQAAELVRSLSPHPCHDQEEDAPPAYVTPDVFVAEREGRLQVFLNDYYTPRVSLSGYYTALLKDTDDASAREFLCQRMQQARWVIDCLSRRHSTLQSCAQVIFQTQNGFFSGDTPYLTPMTRREAAGQMGVHESTVGRCIRGKYLQCRQGTYPLRYFFSRPAGGTWSEQALRLELARLIAQEDRHRPLSDQQLSLLLAQQGMPTARRTVAKYRQALGIPPAYGRRQWQKEKMIQP